MTSVWSVSDCEDVRFPTLDTAAIGADRICVRGLDSLQVRLNVLSLPSTPFEPDSLDNNTVCRRQLPRAWVVYYRKGKIDVNLRTASTRVVHQVHASNWCGCWTTNTVCGRETSRGRVGVNCKGS